MTQRNPLHQQNGASAIWARDLDIGYPNDVVVHDVDVEVRQGQSLALVGTNGSGKSTLLKTLVGLIDPVGGQLEVLGAKPGEAPKRVAYMSQFHHSALILPLSARDTVRMGRYANHGLLHRMSQLDEDLITESMERMGAARFAAAPLASLSGGQQQRVYLAQVLARQAELLLLDEPTAGLDAGGRELYQRAVLEEMERGVSVVVATHDVQEAAECDQVMLLARRVVAIGPGQEVLTPEVLLDAFGITVIPGEVPVCVGEMGSCVGAAEQEHVLAGAHHH